MSACAWTAEADAAFDPDIYDCPCGHSYGVHEVVEMARDGKPPVMTCASCEDVPRLVKLAEEAAKADEPAPVPVLPGQLGIFK